METCPIEVHQCHSYILHCFYCVMESCSSIFNYPLEVFIIAFSATCVSIIALVAEKYSLLTPNYWRNFFIGISYHVRL